jgi:hypothetical protein
MSGRGLWWVPVWSLLGLAAVLGFREGLAYASLTEGDAIAAYAARYRAAAGPQASRADCTARPGQAAWLVVTCEGGAGLYEYRITRFGGLAGWSGPGAAEAGGPFTKEPST